MKTITVRILANITATCEIEDNKELISIEEINQDFQDAMQGKKPFSFTNIRALSVEKVPEEEN